VTSGRWRWLLAAVLIAATGAVGLLVSGPSPPRAITLATGQPGGMYDSFGERYAARLGDIGIRTAIVRTNGSIDNLRRLLRGEVDVAFVQSGTYPLIADPDARLRGIAAIYFEPLWVFHRGGASVGALSDLAGQRVSIGLPASGTEAVAAALLREHGIDPAQPNVVRLANAAAVDELRAGRLQAAFFVTSYRDPAIADLLGRRDLVLHSFRRELAYTRRFPGLTPVRLGEGLLDIGRNLPSADTTLLAPAALLACRATLHPRVVEQILKIAQGIHGPGSLIDPPLRFPSRDGLDVPQHEAAEVYLTQGESLASRTLPYPLLRWTPLLRVLAVSLILWIPVVRFLPEVAGWRINRRFGHLYSRLRDVERTLESAGDAGALRAGLAELDRLGQEAQLLCDKVPGHRQHDAYDWRVHLSFVRSLAVARLAGMERAAAGRVADAATPPGGERAVLETS
jgi:TRAP transporter TAXI family solute receptor